MNTPWPSTSLCDELEGESYQGHTVQGDAGMSFEEYVAWLGRRAATDVEAHIAQYGAPTVDRNAKTVRP